MARDIPELPRRYHPTGVANCIWRKAYGLYRRNAEAIGRKFNDAAAGSASTDMGNVSKKLPAIHPGIAINSLPAVNRQPEFAAHCVKEEADQSIFDSALAMAWTAIDAATAPALRNRLISVR